MWRYLLQRIYEYASGARALSPEEKLATEDEDEDDEEEEEDDDFTV